MVCLLLLWLALSAAGLLGVISTVESFAAAPLRSIHRSAAPAVVAAAASLKASSSFEPSSHPSSFDHDHDDDDDEYRPPPKSTTTSPQEEKNAKNNQNFAEESFVTKRKLLSSAYPSDIPARLRGEAIRAALRSGRCVGWHLGGGNSDDDNNGDDEDPWMKVGLVKVTGKGAIDVINGKVTVSVQRQPPQQQKQPPPGVVAASSTSSSFQEACLLTSKGRVIDRLGIAVVRSPPANNDADEAVVIYLLPSPGHAARRLRDHLDKYIFPLDETKVTAVDAPFIFTLASIDGAHVQTCYDQYMVPQLQSHMDSTASSSSSSSLLLAQPLPQPHECRLIVFSDSSSLLILPTSGLSSASGEGYTFVFFNNNDNDTTSISSSSTIGPDLWRYLISNDCPEGPIHAGALEYESLRIESGQPAFGLEMTAYDETTTITKKKKSKQTMMSKPSSNDNDITAVTTTTTTTTAATTNNTTTPAAPLELHYGDLLDLNKGCYLGQEGVASMVKNPRGPPRLLYHVIFDDTMNVYKKSSSSEGRSGGSGGGGGDDDDNSNNNLTRWPVVGDRLYVLGSNEEINVGTITSVAEPSSTGDPLIIGLALIRRADSVLKQMRALDLQLPRRTLSRVDGLVYPPPLDPLDGLEVIIGGTYTIGTLAMVPTRRGRTNQRLYVNDVPDFVRNLPNDPQRDEIMVDYADRDNSGIVAAGRAVGPLENGDNDNEDNDDEAAAELEKAVAEAQAAAAEAIRKEEKLKLLQQRAEEAMARRRNSQKNQRPQPGGSTGE